MDRLGNPTTPTRRIDAGGDVSPAHRRLIEWVARASVGDPFPEPWSFSANPITAIVRTLIELDVIERPRAGTDLAQIARDAAVSAQAWLEANPRPDAPAR